MTLACSCDQICPSQKMDEAEDWGFLCNWLVWFVTSHEGISSAMRRGKVTEFLRLTSCIPPSAKECPLYPVEKKKKIPEKDSDWFNLVRCLDGVVVGSESGSYRTNKASGATSIYKSSQENGGPCELGNQPKMPSIAIPMTSNGARLDTLLCSSLAEQGLQS